MPASNLAKVFGPTLVGYSVPEPDPATMLTETRQQQMVGCCPIDKSFKGILTSASEVQNLALVLLMKLN